MARKRIITKDRVVVALAELHQIHYNQAAEMYVAAKKHVEVFKSDTISGHVNYLVSKQKTRSKNPFVNNVS